jgi:hypothetical protein
LLGAFFSFVFLYANNVSSIVCLHCFKFYFYSLAVEMLFFSLLCPEGINSTNFGKSTINNQSRRQGVSYLTPLVNLVHSERYRHYLAPRLRSGTAICTLEKGEGRADTIHFPMTAANGFRIFPFYASVVDGSC